MTLPGLDTSDISWIGFWNFLDHGASDITPTDVESVMSTSESFSNGVQGQYGVGFSYQSTRQFNVRVKDDGWIIAWLDRTKNEGMDVQAGTDIHGVHDIIRDWTGPGAKDGTYTNLHYVIDQLHSALSNSAEVSFNQADVGIWNYEAPNATTISWISTRAPGSTYGDSYITQFTVNSATNNLYDGWIAGTAGNNDTVTWAINQENLQVAGNGSHGARDVVSRGEVTIGETVEFETSRALTYDPLRGNLTIYILWD